MTNRQTRQKYKKEAYCNAPGNLVGSYFCHFETFASFNYHVMMSHSGTQNDMTG